MTKGKLQLPSVIANLSPDARRQLTGPALRTFFRIAGAWSLKSDEEMRLLDIASGRTLKRWKGGEVSTLRPETLERISYVFGIFKAINTLLPDTAAADAWIHSPNNAPLFGSRPAIYLMTGGGVEGLRAVRQYLDAEIGDDDTLIAPPVMGALMIDPPEGWRFGFPKPYTGGPGQSMEEWLEESGYPRRLITCFQKGFLIDSGGDGIESQRAEQPESSVALPCSNHADQRQR